MDSFYIHHITNNNRIIKFNHFHDCHIVTQSPWPLFISIAATNLIITLFLSINNRFINVKLIFALVNFFLIIFL